METYHVRAGLYRYFAQKSDTAQVPLFLFQNRQKTLPKIPPPAAACLGLPRTSPAARCPPPENARQERTRYRRAGNRRAHRLVMHADIEAGKDNEHGHCQRKPAIPAPPGPQEDQGDGKNVCRTCSCKNKRRNESKTYSQYLTNIANRMHNHPLRGYGASHLQLQSPQKSNVTSYRRRGSPANCPPRRRRAAR